MELDEDTEGLQATIYLLQHQLKEAKDRIDMLEGKGTVKSTDNNSTDIAAVKQSSAEPMEQDSTTEPLTSNPLTHKQVADDELTAEPYGSVVVNGVDTPTNCEVEKLATTSSDKVTTNATLTPVNSNGHTQMVESN